MDNGETDHIHKKRKINGPEEDADDQSDISLIPIPFDPPPPDLCPSAPPPSSPVYRHLSTSATLYSPRICPRPPPSMPGSWQISQAPTLIHPIYYPRPQSPFPPLLSPRSYRHVYPTATCNSPILYPRPPRSPYVPVYRSCFPTAPINPPILCPQPSPSPPPLSPSVSISRLFSSIVTRNSQEPSGYRDVPRWPPRPRRKSSQLLREGKSLEIAPPYPWSTDRRCTVHSLQHLLSIQLDTITGQVQCKSCGRNYEMEFDLRKKLSEIFQFIIENKNQMYDRAPRTWMNPALPPCRFCEEENCAKPIISDKKRTINWLFLLLGQMLGCCTLDQLRYFCKHNNSHRTGAKDRVLYQTYMGLCKQLDPNGPFDL